MSSNNSSVARANQNFYINPQLEIPDITALREEIQEIRRIHAEQYKLLSKEVQNTKHIANVLTSILEMIHKEGK